MAGMVPQQTQSAQVPQSAQPILDSKSMNAAQAAFVQSIGNALNGQQQQAPQPVRQAPTPQQPAPAPAPSRASN